MFRTADAAGVSKIYVSGYSPSPIDRFGRPVKEIAKTALDAQEFIPWEYLSEPFEKLSELKKEGWLIVGLEQDARAQDYRKSIQAEKIVLVVGTEVGGMDQETREVCDVLVEIPMHGKKDSLNVSVATGIALFALC